MPLIWDHIPLFEGTRRVLVNFGDVLAEWIRDLGSSYFFLQEGRLGFIIFMKILLGVRTVEVEDSGF